MRRNSAFYGIGTLVVAVCSHSSASADDFENRNPNIAPGYASCLWSRYPTFIEDWLRTLPASGEERVVIKRNQLSVDNCFGVNSDGSRYFSSYNYSLIRFGLVRSWLQAHRSMLTSATPKGLADANWYVSYDSVVPTDGRAGAITNGIGFCLARQNWEGVRRIVLAVDPKSERRSAPRASKGVQERELRVIDPELDKMIPLISGCIPSGVTVSLNRFKLRSLLEETAFHAVSSSTAARAEALVSRELN